jgi:hypothetical protein
MARATKRRKLPTLIDRGMGLLEVILPHGSHDDTVLTLPPGQRDTGGFWFPEGYTQPGDIFTPAQRKLQAKQRQVQRHRLKGQPVPPPIVSGSEGTAAADTTPSRPHAPPDSCTGGLADRPLPLPAPSREAPEVRLDHTRPAASVVRSTLTAPPQARAMAPGPVVDSREGSD